MADHRAENIIAAVVTNLTGLATTGADVFRGRVYELPDSELPALCIYLGTDNPRSDGGSSSWKFIDSELTINIEAVVKDSAAQVDTTLNQIRYEVGQALLADYTQGIAYVINTTEGPATPDLSGEGEKITGRLRMEWTVYYRRERYVTPSPVLPATYPLDADSVEVSGVGYLPMTLSGGDQTATLTLEGAPASDRDALAFPTGLLAMTAQTIAFDVGIKAIEWEPILPATVGGGAGAQAYRIEITHASVAFANIASISLEQNDDGTKAVSVIVDGMPYTDAPASFPARIGIAADSTTNTLRVYFDNVELVLPSNTYTPAESVITLGAFEKTDCPAGDAGKLIGATLYTAAADLTGTTYPVGTTDIGGNVI